MESQNRMTVRNRILVDHYRGRKYPGRQVILRQQPLQLAPCGLLLGIAVLEGDPQSARLRLTVQVNDKPATSEEIVDYFEHGRGPRRIDRGFNGGGESGGPRIYAIANRRCRKST